MDYESVLHGKWQQLKGEVIKEWGQLTVDDLERIEGDYDALVGRLQERYGYSRPEAEKEVKVFLEGDPTKGDTP